MAEKVIELVHLQKQFGTHQVLRDISLSVEKGEVLSIIGASGSGKSTMLRCINLLETPTAGQILYHGKDITSRDLDLAKYRTKVGMVFQSFNLFNNMTALNNCVTGQMSVLKRSRREAEEVAMKYLTKVGMSPYIHAKPAQLSGGQKQRVAIARALATKPRYLLCDEATSALDPTTTQSILSLLKEINRTMGVTVIVITHEMRVIDQICDRVAVIDRGQIAELGAVSQVFTNPQSKIARELILPGVSIAPVFTPGGKRIRLAFNGETTRHPVVASLIMECQAPVNIVSADIREIDGKIYGQTILELPADEASAERARAWLKQDGVSFEEV